LATSPELGWVRNGAAAVSVSRREKIWSRPLIIAWTAMIRNRISLRPGPIWVVGLGLDGHDYLASV
jgi:hypothetical protein